MNISIRAPARGATCNKTLVSIVFTISIRAPARGATYDTLACVGNLTFQSALPRGERRTA